MNRGKLIWRSIDWRSIDIAVTYYRGVRLSRETVHEASIVTIMCRDRLPKGIILRWMQDDEYYYIHGPQPGGWNWEKPRKESEFATEQDAIDAFLEMHDLAIDLTI